MKQNVLIEVCRTDCKSRSKVLKIAAGHSGVESAALKGNEKNQIEVVGDGIDPVELTRSIRKSVGFAKLIKVEPVGEKKEGGGEKKEGGGEKKSVAPKPTPTPTPTPTPQPPVIVSYPCGMPQYQPVCEVVAPHYEPFCTIL